MEFDKIIDTLINNISNLNSSIENTKAPVINTEITISNNILSRDQYTMESIQRKQDYINYKPQSLETPLHELITHYQQDKLIEVSKIENVAIMVE